MTSGAADGLLGSAYIFFREHIDGWISEDPANRKQRAAAIVAGVKQGLVFVVIDLGSDDEGQLIYDHARSLCDNALFKRNRKYIQRAVQGGAAQ